MAATTVGVGPKRLEGSIMRRGVAAITSKICERLQVGPVFISGLRPTGPWSSRGITTMRAGNRLLRLASALGIACPSLKAKSYCACGQSRVGRSSGRAATLRPSCVGLRDAANGRRPIGRASLAKVFSAFGQNSAGLWCGLCSCRRLLPRDA